MTTVTETATARRAARSPSRRPGHAAAPGDRPRRSARRRSERRLGWLLCAPAAIVMLAVTAYPIGYAICLSLQRADLRFPDANKFVGFENYRSVLSSSSGGTTSGPPSSSPSISVSIELVLGMALAVVMHRALFGRGSCGRRSSCRTG